jgi:endo-1,3-1,4-beta-glycanase ExoK
MSRNSNLEQSFHTYTFIWTPKSIVWYVDGKKSWQTNSNVPTKPAQIRINHWGIDNPKFGGSATVNVDRYMYVKSVSFAPLAGK